MARNFPYPPEDFSPSLTNSFSRITIAGIETSERITIDYDISFADPRNGTSGKMEYLSVVELKREGLAGESPVHMLLRNLGSYQTGFSKYVMGLAFLNERFRKNAVRLKFIKLKKIENVQAD
ncbi:MAG: hypothetical protein MUE32_01300 [Bacteroidales bacterium]|nr:hypothetical protein [Bacteroidales bacterium]